MICDHLNQFDDLCFVRLKFGFHLAMAGRGAAVSHLLGTLSATS